MKNKILDLIMNNIKKYYSYDETKLKEIRYGLESLYLSIFKVIVILIISFFIHTTKELCLLFIFYGILRLTAFGLHTKNSIQCWLSSISVFSLIPYLIKKIIINNYILYPILIICLILIIIYAPADTEKRPLIRKKKRIIYKVLSSIIVSIYIVYILLTNNSYIHNILFFSIILQTILILPITYKIYGLKYANYKLYKGKEVKKWNY